jgi:hypothetical protein
MGLWQPAAKDAAGKWFGASWAFHDSTSYQSGRKWSSLPTKAVWGRVGDLSTVLESITSETVRINFPVSPGVASADITAIVRRWAEGELPNRGVYLDVSHLQNPVANATTRTVRVGVRGHLWSVEAERPRIVIEWEADGVGPEPSPTPTPEPTPTPSPTPEPTPQVITLRPGQEIVVRAERD